MEPIGPKGLKIIYAAHRAKKQNQEPHLNPFPDNLFLGTVNLTKTTEKDHYPVKIKTHDIKILKLLC